MKEDPWHDREEAFLTKIEQQCNDYAAHHSKDHMYYNKLSSRFNIPILIISSINALTAISLNSFLDQEYVSILNAVLSAGTGVLGSIQLYMKLNGDKLPPGVKVELITRDDTGPNPDVAKRIAQELIVRDKVNFLTGIVWTPNMAAIGPLDELAAGVQLEFGAITPIGPDLRVLARVAGRDRF